MKKWIIIEVAALVVLLIVAALVYTGMLRPASAPEATEESTSTPTETAEQTEATTEPEPTWMMLPATYQLTCQQHFVFDCDTQQFTVISGSTDERIYPASITKLFTAYVATQYLSPEQMITAGDELDMVAWGSSVAELTKGDTLSVELLVEAMLLPSGNDAAHVLAAAAGRAISGQEDLSAAAAVAAFMEEMNAQAAQLGMTGSHFVNPDGIHSDDHYMSFADLALLGRLSVENPTVLEYAKVSRHIVDLQDGPIVWKNTNELTNPISEFYCPYAVGLKTGQTPSAGSCLLSAFKTEDRTLIIGVFGCPDIDDRFADTLLLFNQELGIQ